LPGLETQREVVAPAQLLQLVHSDAQSRSSSEGRHGRGGAIVVAHGESWRRWPQPHGGCKRVMVMREWLPDWLCVQSGVDNLPTECNRVEKMMQTGLRRGLLSIVEVECLSIIQVTGGYHACVVWVLCRYRSKSARCKLPCTVELS
jgi:hypothetical protein